MRMLLIVTKDAQFAVNPAMVKDILMGAEEPTVTIYFNPADSHTITCDNQDHTMEAFHSIVRAINTEEITAVYLRRYQGVPPEEDDQDADEEPDDDAPDYDCRD